MRRLTVLIITIIFSNFVFAQNDDQPPVSGFMKTVKVGSVKTDFDFTPEWQYVSSDLYMFNTERFADVINAIITGKKTRWWRKHKFDLQNILITLNMQGLGTYDKITFPLFNFVLEHDPENGYKISSQSSEVIRILDNYPAPAINDFITAKVDVKVITKDNQVEIYKLAANQLETISMVATNPTGAVMQLVGEFGKMIQSAADKREYHFSSTIRIYENDNFNQRLHSIVVFAFVPSGENEFKIDVDMSKLQKVLQSDTMPQIDRRFLYKYINIRKYPYVVIVNYKSKYIPDVPEDIDFDIIKSREAKLVSDYKRGVIRPEIYELEKELLEFLKKIAQLQLDLNNYNLNLQNRTTEDFSKFYYLIYRDYWDILTSYHSILALRNDNQIFQNDFKKYYQKFMTKATMNLDQDINLRNIREMTDLLYSLENSTADLSMDSLQLEQYMAKLNAVKLPQSEANSPEVQLLDKWRGYLEQEFYQQYFQSYLDYLKSLPVNDESYKIVTNYQAIHGRTQCQICKRDLNDFMKTFMQEYHEYKMTQAKQQFEQVRISTKSALIGITKKISCMRQYFANYQGTKPEYLQMIEQDMVRLDDQRQTLMGLLNRNYVFTSEADIEKVISDITGLRTKLENDLENLCSQEEHLCDCKAQLPKQPMTNSQPQDTAKPAVDTVKAVNDTVKPENNTVKPVNDTINADTAKVQKKDVKMEGAEPEPENK